VDAAGEVRCWGIDDGDPVYDFGQVTATPTSTGWVEVDVGRFHTCATDAAGTTDCWGIDDGSVTDLGQVTDHP
jgi:hypothetical protein